MKLKQSPFAALIRIFPEIAAYLPQRMLGKS